MQIRATLKPGRRGTKKWHRQHGDRLVCVRYRYDARRLRRYTTIEIIVAESPWAPPDLIVGVRGVARTDTALQKKIKSAGGHWDRPKQLWQLRYDQVVALGLLDRLVPPDEQPSA